MISYKLSSLIFKTCLTSLQVRKQNSYPIQTLQKVYTVENSVFFLGRDTVSLAEHFSTFGIVVVPSSSELSRHSFWAGLLWIEKPYDPSKLGLQLDQWHVTFHTKCIPENRCDSLRFLPQFLIGDSRQVSCRRHKDFTHRRHRVLTPQPGRVIVTQRHYGKTGKTEIPQRRTTGLFRSSQWGSATVPYKGAKVNVPVLSGNKKASSVEAHMQQSLEPNANTIKLIIHKAGDTGEHPHFASHFVWKEDVFMQRVLSFHHFFIPYKP